MRSAVQRGMTLPGSTIGSKGGGKGVGTFNVHFSVRSADGNRSLELVGMVDTGALYSIIPASVLDNLGIARDEQEHFYLSDGSVADGSVIDMSIGLALIEIDDRSRTVHVAFGPADDVVLIGAMTLERFGVAADPVHERLVPARVTM